MLEEANQTIPEKLAMLANRSSSFTGMGNSGPGYARRGYPNEGGDGAAFYPNGGGSNQW